MQWKFLVPQEQVMYSKSPSPLLNCFHRYGVGYHMTMVKDSSCSSGRVTRLVQETVAGAEQVTDVGAELSFLLPAQSTQQFPDLFDILDSKYTY